MPLIPYHKEEPIRQAIRKLIIKNPMIGIAELQEELRRRGYESSSGGLLHHQYVSKLVRKIKAAAEHYSGSQSELSRISEIRERGNMVLDRLFKVAFWQTQYMNEGIWPPSVMEMTIALKTIVELDLKMYEAEKIAGLFKREAQNIIDGNFRNREMPEEYYNLIEKTFKAHGFGPHVFEVLAQRTHSHNDAATTSSSSDTSAATPAGSGLVVGPAA